MRILITGATGFIASHIVACLHQAGHEIIAAVRNVNYARERFHYAEIIHCDFNQDTDPTVWRQRLEQYNIDVVINCVGVLQGSVQQSINAIHQDTPIALFKACDQANIKRVIQLSALGAGESDTLYAKTKQTADDYLLSLNHLSRLVLRPSVVYGTGSYGGTSLFRGLSALPGFIPLVGKGQQVMAPIFLNDLSKAILHYIEQTEISGKIIYAVGPETITQRNLLLKIRAWLGLPKAICIAIPLIFITIIAKLGNWFAKSPINDTTLKMLQQGNIHDPGDFTNSIPFKVRSIDEVFNSHPSSTQDRWHAKLYFLRPLLRISLVLLWFISGIIPFINPTQSEFLLARIGIPTTLLVSTRLILSFIDISIGLAVLLRWRIRLVGMLQFFIVLIYTFIATFTLGEQWLNPLGPLIKNIPILMVILIWMAVEDDR